MPLYKFHITVPLSPVLATRRLQADIVEMRGFLGFFTFLWESWFIREPQEFFVGTVKGNRFNIRLIRHRHRNFFHPNIRGKITTSGKGSNIDILFYMNPFGAAFLTYWLYSGISAVLAGGLQPPKMFIAGLAFFITGFLIALGWFWSNATLAKKALMLLWSDEETKILINTGSVKDKIKCEKCGHLNASNCNKCLYCGTDIVSV